MFEIKLSGDIFSEKSIVSLLGQRKNPLKRKYVRIIYSDHKYLLSTYFMDFPHGSMVKNTRSDLVLWEDLEGVGGEGGERGDRDGEYM